MLIGRDLYVEASESEKTMLSFKRGWDIYVSIEKDVCVGCIGLYFVMWTRESCPVDSSDPYILCIVEESVDMYSGGEKDACR